MEAFIKKLRHRAAIQKYLSFLALAGAVVIVWIGTDYFIHESPKIAAQDIEQQRKLISSQDVISRLASLNMNIFKNTEQLSNAENELNRIQEILSNDGIHLLEEINSNYYFDVEKPYRSTLNETHQQNFYSLRGKRLNEIDILLDNIKKANGFLEGDKAIDKYLNDLQASQDSNKKHLEQFVESTERLKKDLNHVRNTMKQIGETTSAANLKNLILLNVQQIRSLEQKIKEFDEKMNSGEFQKEAEEQIKTMLQTNRRVIEQIEAFKIKVISNRDLFQEKLQKQQELFDKLRAEKANLEAEREFTVSRRSGAEPVMADSKVAFYVSTNIARLGIMIVTLFLA